MSVVSRLGYPVLELVFVALFSALPVVVLTFVGWGLGYFLRLFPLIRHLAKLGVVVSLWFILHLALALGSTVLSLATGHPLSFWQRYGTYSWVGLAALSLFAGLGLAGQRRKDSAMKQAPAAVAPAPPLPVAADQSHAARLTAESDYLAAARKAYYPPEWATEQLPVLSLSGLVEAARRMNMEATYIDSRVATGYSLQECIDQVRGLTDDQLGRWFAGGALDLAQRAVPEDSIGLG